MAGMPKTLTREDVPDVSPPLDPEHARILDAFNTSCTEFQIAQHHLRLHPYDDTLRANALDALQMMGLLSGDLEVYYQCLR
jgi:hypothetical protein